MKPMNTEQLSKIAKNKTAEAVFTSWAVRERNTDEIDVARTKNMLLGEGFKIVPEELVSALKDLEKAGFGEFKLNKKGQPTRFRLNYSIKEIGKAALGDKTAPLTVKKAVPLTKYNESYLTSKNNFLVILLSAGRKVKVDFPNNMTSSDIKLVYDTLVEAVKI